MNVKPKNFGSETVMFRTAQEYLLFLGDVSKIKNPLLKWLRISSVIAQNFMIFTTGMLGYFSPLELSTAVSSTLVNKMHVIIIFPIIQLIMFLNWQKRELLLEVANEFTKLMFHFQIPIEPKIRVEIIRKTEARHLLIARAMTCLALTSAANNALKPLIVHLLDPSPDKCFRLPFGMLDPAAIFTDDTRIDINLLRGVLYFFFVVTAFSAHLVLSYIAILIFLMTDGLTTLFRLSGSVFRTLGNDESGRKDHLRSAIQFHQRLFRLFSNVAAFVESPLSIEVFFSCMFNIICVLFLTQDSIYKNLNLVTGILGNMTTIPVFFILPTITYYVAEEVGNRTYFNDNWFFKRQQYAGYFKLIIMRAGDQIKFRVFNFWVLSSENFVNYLNQSYSFYVVLQVVTEKYSKNQNKS